jgi:hypothetical protein
MPSYGVRPGCIRIGHDFHFRTFPNCGAAIDIRLPKKQLRSTLHLFAQTHTGLPHKPPELPVHIKHFKTNTNHWQYQLHLI